MKLLLNANKIKAEHTHKHNYVIVPKYTNNVYYGIQH